MTQADFDLIKLQGYLDRLFGSSTDFNLTRISGGQSNPTYFVTHGGRDMVLRKQPNGPILKGAHAVDREYRIQSALAQTDVPVAEQLHFCNDEKVLGTPFYLMQRVAGRVFDDAALTAVATEDRKALWFAAADAMAAMHSVDPDAIGLSDFGRHQGYFPRQMKRWLGQWEASESGPIPELDQLAKALNAAMPDEDGVVSIAHGDFRMGNLLYDPREPRVAAILDWELSTLGHPLADLGFCCMAWNTAPDEYGGLLGLDLDAAGLPTEAEFVSRYMEKSSRPLELKPFHKAFALFRFAAIWVGIADRARQGNAASDNAAELGPLARRFAIRGLEVMSA